MQTKQKLKKVHLPRFNFKASQCSQRGRCLYLGFLVLSLSASFSQIIGSQLGVLAHPEGANLLRENAA